MQVLTSVCAIAALAIGATQATSNGLQTFLNRPEGVGATPPDEETDSAANAPSAKAQGPSDEEQPAQPQDDPAPVAPEPRDDSLPPGFDHPDGGHHHRPPGHRDRD